MIPQQYSILSVLGDVHHTYDFSTDTATVFHKGEPITEVAGLERDGCRVYSSWAVEQYLWEHYGKAIWGLVKSRG